MKNICERLLLKMRSWNWEKIKIVHEEFLTLYSGNKWKCLFLFHERNKWKWLFLFQDWFPLEFVFKYNISVMWWEINSKQLISIWVNQKRSKVQEKNMSWKRGLNLDQWKTFSENYKPMRVWLWLVYKFVENYCGLQLFSEFIQT